MSDRSLNRKTHTQQNTQQIRITHTHIHTHTHKQTDNHSRSRSHSHLLTPTALQITLTLTHTLTRLCVALLRPVLVLLCSASVPVFVFARLVGRSVGRPVGRSVGMWLVRSVGGSSSRSAVQNISLRGGMRVNATSLDEVMCWAINL